MLQSGYIFITDSSFQNQGKFLLKYVLIPQALYCGPNGVRYVEGPLYTIPFSQSVPFPRYPSLHAHMAAPTTVFTHPIE